ncbi:TetR/AcrR family transcriptional regulator [Sphingobacterium faecale]|uniref:TetR/AcrR family transcriptional regulator n=1 Tax=Sphingobacterium faecale TaxID=2803775 RepID=A0ABS1R6K8_9SPHI|nr:TetR/AcrR family transcriptional regulator [Sphingobacterium faecale]MBL1409930.1 TetR/AcrR family transcriptional regulator [Sphingobacterium faecale]
MKKQKARDRILDTTKRLFYKQGYNSTGINQIIEEADVAKSTLFQHFSTKKELCSTYLEELTEEYVSNHLELIADDSSVRMKITKIYERLRNDVIKNEFRGCHFHNLLSEISSDDKDLLPIIKKNKESARNIFHQLLDEATDSSFADFAFVLYEGAIIQTQVQQDVWPIDNALEMMIKLLKQYGQE